MMKIRLGSMEQAFGVLNTIDLLTAARGPRDGEGGFQLTPYMNGREDGFHLVKFPTMRAISFSRFRTSDAIVIYYGQFGDFDGYGCPNEACYERAAFYPRGSWHDAANFILAHLDAEDSYGGEED